MEQCLGECEKRACQTVADEQKGCSQMFSCSHGCKMRQLGLPKGECIGNCQRNGSSGCRADVRGYTFKLCASCEGQGCSAKGPTIEECEIGCTRYDGKFLLVNPLYLCKNYITHGMKLNEFWQNIFFFF